MFRQRILALMSGVRDVASESLLWAYNAFILAPRKNVRSVVHISLISNKQYMLSRTLRQKGFRSAYIALNTSPGDRLDIGHDYHIPMKTRGAWRRWLEFWYLWTVLARYDVVHYHFNAFLALDDGWELDYLRRMGKVIVFHFRGCDVRYRSRNMALFPDLNICQECDYPEGACDTPYQHGRLAVVQEYADLLFATTPDNTRFIDGTEHIPFIAPFGIDLDAIEAMEKKPGTFRVVTSSNHPGIDGVPYLRKAVERLRSEGENLELVEVIRRPYAEALSIYKSADLYAGKLRLGYYNNANIETLAMGIPNMAFIREDFRDLIPDSPIIVATPDTIYERLKEWIAKPEALREIGARGPEFVHRHHDPARITDMMIERYNRALAAKRQTGSCANRSPA